MTAPAQRGEAGRGHHVVLVWTRPYFYICAAFGGARSMSRRRRSGDAEPARGTEFHSLSARHRTRRPHEARSMAPFEASSQERAGIHDVIEARQPEKGVLVVCEIFVRGVLKERRVAHRAAQEQAPARAVAIQQHATAHF